MLDICNRKNEFDWATTIEWMHTNAYQFWCNVYCPWF